MGVLISWLITAVALYLTALIVPGVRVAGFAGAMLAALVLGIVNAVLRPVILLLTLPLNILTLGLFTFAVNALMLYVVARVTHQIVLSGALAAFAGALVLSAVGFVLRRLVNEV
ncbi:MAG TPA: phage holin family protein [bacterium]|nr:phage holin family protein [bacterium]